MTIVPATPTVFPVPEIINPKPRAAPSAPAIRSVLPAPIKKPDANQYEPINFEATLPPPEATQRGSIKGPSASLRTVQGCRSLEKPPLKLSDGKIKPWTLKNIWKG
jgi:hypothetical protein